MNGKSQGLFDWPTPTSSTGGPSRVNTDNPRGRHSGNPIATAVQMAEEKVEIVNWATPNTLDSLPPRTEEGVIRQARGSRKGRARPANLREQVDARTCEIYALEKKWPTPCVRDYKGANGGGSLTRKDGKSRMDQLPNAVLYGPRPRSWKQEKYQTVPITGKPD